MANDRTTYPEYRHVMVARYGPFRIDRVWTRTNPADEHEWLPELVFELDAPSEFDLMSSLFVANVATRVRTGEVLSASGIHRVVSRWLPDMRPRPESGVVSLACYRRHIGSP